MDTKERRLPTSCTMHNAHLHPSKQSILIGTGQFRHYLPAILLAIYGKIFRYPNEDLIKIVDSGGPYHRQVKTYLTRSPSQVENIRDSHIEYLGGPGSREPLDCKIKIVHPNVFLDRRWPTLSLEGYRWIPTWLSLLLLFCHCQREILAKNCYSVKSCFFGVDISVFHVYSIQ